MFLMALLLLRPLRLLRQRGSSHSVSSFNGTPVLLAEPASLGSGSTLPRKPQQPNDEHCRTRARQRRRSRLRICQQIPQKKDFILLSTRGRQSCCSRVQSSGCMRFTRDRQRCCVSQSRRERGCDPLILRAACNPWKLKPRSLLISPINPWVQRSRHACEDLLILRAAYKPCKLKSLSCGN